MGFESENKRRLGEIVEERLKEVGAEVVIGEVLEQFSGEDQLELGLGLIERGVKNPELPHLVAKNINKFDSANRGPMSDALISFFANK
jgi:hypothetical protein